MAGFVNWISEFTGVTFSVVRSMWVIFWHFLRKRETILYPEVKQVMPPRWRGRIILSRDPDGKERCVACYLCAAACPVDCISLQATEDAARQTLSGILPHKFLTLHLLRLLRRSVPDVRHPAHARLRDGRV